MSAEVTYTVSDENALEIAYRARSSAPTVINLTNHSYWNLAGEGCEDVLGHWLQSDAVAFVPADDDGIPLGSVVPTEGTPFDFRAGKAIGRDIRRADLPWGEGLIRSRGYDHHLVLAGTGLRPAATLRDSASGRMLRILTTEPGLQLYTAGLLAGELRGPGGRLYRAGDGVALETQHAPDSPHHLGEPDWPSVVVGPGRDFASRTVFSFGLAPGAAG